MWSLSHFDSFMTSVEECPARSRRVRGLLNPSFYECSFCRLLPYSTFELRYNRQLSSFDLARLVHLFVLARVYSVFHLARTTRARYLLQSLECGVYSIFEYSQPAHSLESDSMKSFCLRWVCGKRSMTNLRVSPVPDTCLACPSC